MANVEVSVRDPKSMGIFDWTPVQALQKNAFLDSFKNRSPKEIDWLVRQGDTRAFSASHRDPNAEVGKRFNANNLYTNPRVALASHLGRVVGFAYTADNVSGGGSPEGPHNDSLKAQAIRNMKRLSVVKNYLWIREVAVDPEFQGEGLSIRMTKALLDHAKDHQPIVAYVWPGEDEGRTRTILENYGFAETGSETLPVFGEDAPPTEQVRMQAPSVKTVY